MDLKLLQLQKDIRELRQQNFQQKDIQYVPLNIISNNLYINNSLNKSSINASLPENNNIFNSLISGREIQNKMQDEQKRKTPHSKLAIKKGMFSYKTSLSNGNNYNGNYNYNTMFKKNINNIIEVNEPNYNYSNYKYNNNSLLSAKLKLNLDDNINENNNNLEPNNIIGERILSTSS